MHLDAAIQQVQICGIVADMAKTMQVVASYEAGTTKVLHITKNELAHHFRVKETDITPEYVTPKLDFVLIGHLEGDSLVLGIYLNCIYYLRNTLNIW